VIKRKLIIDAPIDIVFRVIRDFAAYPEFLTATKSAKERKKGAQILADFSVEVVKPISYTLRFVEEPPSSLSWSLVEGELMKSNEGSWKLKSLSDSQTEANYSIDISFGWLVPKMIVNEVTKTQLPEMLEAFKERAENAYAIQLKDVK
jgi:ribosome-associated toxin RatA of RatAB toxin-antitoxin module